MKIHFFILVFFLGIATLRSQTTFNRTYDFDGGWEIVTSVIEVDDGYVLIGEGGNEVFSNWGDIRLAKIDFDGNIIWQKIYGDSGVVNIPGWTSIKFSNGLLGFAGFHIANDTSHILLFKFDSETGDTVFTKIIYTEGQQAGICMRELNNGDLVISATADIAPACGVYFMKTDSIGNIIWQNTYSIPGVDWNGYFDINSANHIAYVTNYMPCGTGFRMNEIDTSGNLVFSSAIGEGCVYLASKSINDGFLVYGIYSLELWQDYLARLDDDLDSIWNYRTSLRDDVIGYSDGQISFAWYDELEDGSIVNAGFYDSYPTYDYNAFISKLSPDGEELWIRHYAADTGNYEGWDYNMIRTSDNGFLLSGSGFGAPYDEWNNPTQNFWALKLDSMGCLIPGCDTLDDAIFELSYDEAGIMVYPNPVSIDAIVQITFNEPVAMNKLELKLFDISGRCVSAFQVGELSQDNNKVRFGFLRNNLASGIYLLQLSSGNMLIGSTRLILN